MWTQDGSTPTAAGACTGGNMSLQGALGYVSCLNTNNYLGHNDWRLPNRNELISLTNYGQSNSGSWLNSQGFSNVGIVRYWSSTTDALSPNATWDIYVYIGYANSDTKTDSNYVWPVRAGQ